MLIKVNQLIPVGQNFCYAAREENVTGAIELLLCKVCKPIGNCVCVCGCVCVCVHVCMCVCGGGGGCECVHVCLYMNVTCSRWR